MTKIIDIILEHDKDGIIIVLGDHGPSLLNNCGLIKNREESFKADRKFLLDNYGAFLATKFPKNYQINDIKSIQNIFHRF